MSTLILRWVFHNSPTWGADRLVLLALAHRADGNGRASPSLADLIELTQADRRTVQRSLRALESEGHVRKTTAGYTIVRKAKVPVSRKRLPDAVWAGMRELFRYEPTTGSERSLWGKVRGEIADAIGYRKGGEGYDVVRAEVVRRGNAIKQRYPTIHLSPMMLSRHWGAVGPKEQCLVCGSAYHDESVHAVEMKREEGKPATSEQVASIMTEYRKRHPTTRRKDTT